MPPERLPVQGAPPGLSSQRYSSSHDPRRFDRSGSNVFWIPVVLTVGLAAPAMQGGALVDHARPGSTWQAAVEAQVAARELEEALAVADTRLRDEPGDEDARFWRARLLTWLGRWPEAQREYQ